MPIKLSKRDFFRAYREELIGERKTSKWSKVLKMNGLAKLDSLSGWNFYDL